MQVTKLDASHLQEFRVVFHYRGTLEGPSRTGSEDKPARIVQGRLGSPVLTNLESSPNDGGTTFSKLNYDHP